jgi:methylenetetrahydrofolate dehydrogenase (NADP+)/methenyltetrahydrofolate cyclohydrolase
MVILDGKRVADGIYQKIELELGRHENVRLPRLDIFRVGNSFGSRKYVNMKERVAKRLGFDVRLHEFGDNANPKSVVKKLKEVNGLERVDGCMVQLPLAEDFSASQDVLIDLIDINKDVDGMKPESLGRLFVGDECFASATPKGIMLLLEEYAIQLEGKEVVVIGRSSIVGLPLFALMNRANATVTLCHSKTEELKSVASRADILVTAVGKAGMIGESYVKEGAVVVDVGISPDQYGNTAGDVDLKSVKDKVSYITPVPGGVGPMTIAALMSNTFESWSTTPQG